MSGDRPGGTEGSATRGGPSADLQRVALRHRVRTITDGAIDVDSAGVAGSSGAVVGAVVDGHGYAQTGDARGLGGLLRWALASGADRLTVVAESGVAPGLARRASLLDYDIAVWSADGAEVEPAGAEPAPTPPPIPEPHRRFVPVITETGARAIDDHGMLVAEVAGLEVGRVVDGDSGEPELAVGVGQADRELQQYIHGHLDDDTNLRRAIAAVVRDRHPGTAAHPLTRVARQRWLRSTLMDDPSPLGLDRLEPVVPLRPRETVLGEEPAAAEGNGTIVVCSVGVDLDLVPEAADYRNRDNPEADLVLVLPERDRELAVGALGSLVPRLTVTSIPAPWERTH